MFVDLTTVMNAGISNNEELSLAWFYKQWQLRIIEEPGGQNHQNWSSRQFDMYLPTSEPSSTFMSLDMLD